jgi:hypothetical protein
MKGLGLCIKVIQMASLGMVFFEALAEKPQTSFSLMPVIGYGQETLQYSIGFPNTIPNIVSELTWSDLKVMTLGIEGEANFLNNFVAQGSIEHGRIFKGDHQDADYSGNNRTLKWSHSRAHTKGHTVKINLGIGKKYNLHSNLIFSPFIGFSFQRNFFKNKDLVQIGSEPRWAPENHIPLRLGLKSEGFINSYAAQFYGPWVGIQGTWQFASKWTLEGGLKGQYGWFISKGNWVKVQMTFKDKSQGYGLDAHLGVFYEINPAWDLSFKVNGHYIKVGRGDESCTKEGISGDHPNYFRGAVYKSIHLLLGVRYQF